jgi:hypothetical protein
MLAVGWFRHNRYFALSRYPSARKEVTDWHRASRAAFRRDLTYTSEIALEGPESAAFAMQAAPMLGL